MSTNPITADIAIIPATPLWKTIGQNQEKSRICRNLYHNGTCDFQIKSNGYGCWFAHVGRRSIMEHNGEVCPYGAACMFFSMESPLCMKLHPSQTKQETKIEDEAKEHKHEIQSVPIDEEFRFVNLDHNFKNGSRVSARCIISEKSAESTKQLIRSSIQEWLESIYPTKDQIVENTETEKTTS